jgi:heat shock protein HslJ
VTLARIISLALIIGVTGCAAAISTPKSADLSGQWTVESIDDRPVIDKSLAYIEFTPEGRAGGNASCNRFTGSYVLSGSNLTFSKLASTKMMCAPALMGQETGLLAALERVAKVQLQDGLLFLQDAGGATVIKASRREGAK